MYAGITVMHYPPGRTDDVYKHIREVLTPFHQKLQSQGMREAFFLVNPESCQGIGIAVWDEAAKLREVEMATARTMSRSMRDPTTAPTEYTRLRAQWVQDLAGGIVSTDWYEIVGRVPYSSVLFPSPSGSFGWKGAYAGITMMHYPPAKTDDVYKHIREVLTPFHASLQSKGMKDALFLVNPDTCEGIGIAIWDEAGKLRQQEQGTSRSMSRAVRDPSSAPTEYTRLRAEWVQDLSGGIDSTDWYEVVGRVPAISATGSAPGATATTAPAPPTPTRPGEEMASWN